MRRFRLLGAVTVILAVVALVLVYAPGMYGQTPGDSGGRRPALPERPGLFESGSEIGATVRDVESADTTREKLPSQAGAVIERVRPDGPAAKAGLKAGDVVVEFDGEKVRSARQLVRLVRESPEGRPVKTVVVRGGQSTTLEVTPQDGGAPWAWRGDEFQRALPDLRGLERDLRSRIPEFDAGRLPGGGRLGVNILDLPPQLASYFGVKEGVLIIDVGEDSPAGRAGLKAGDVITAIAGHSVASRSDLIRALRDASGRDVGIEVTRDHKSLTLKATLEDHQPSGRPRSGRGQ